MKQLTREHIRLNWRERSRWVVRIRQRVVRLALRIQIRLVEIDAGLCAPRIQTRALVADAEGGCVARDFALELLAWTLVFYTYMKEDRNGMDYGGKGVLPVTVFGLGVVPTVHFIASHAVVMAARALSLSA